MKNNHILVICDDIVVRSQISAALIKSGYAVVAVKKPSYAKRIIDSYHDVSINLPLIVLEFDLTDFSVIDFLEQLDSDGIDTHTILLFEPEELETVFEIVGHRLEEYLIKPVKTQELLGKVRSILKNRVISIDRQPELTDELHRLRIQKREHNV